MQSPGATPPLVIFDGSCNLCSGSVAFIRANDPAGRFRFAPRDTPEAQTALAASRAGGEDVASVVLLQDGRIFTRSDAALRIARGLRAPVSLLGALLAVPRPIRDAVYGVIARNRYRWFGRRPAAPSA